MNLPTGCRSFCRGCFAAAAGVFLVLPASPAQQPVSGPGMGSVTGHVTCGDTERPARFAMIMLFGVPKTLTPPVDPNAKQDEAQRKAAIKAAMDSMNGLNMVQTETGMDGGYAAANVAPGDYYVFASVPGYVQPASMVQAALDTGADLSKPIPGIPIVHVVADRSVSSDVAVQRGAAISGKVVWDDGSPVARAIVMLEPAKTDKKMPSQFAMLGMAGGIGGGGVVSISDDLGQFRIAGLAAGDYLAKATLQVNSNFSLQAGVMNINALASIKPLVIYAPAALHKWAAKAVTLTAGEEQRDQLITVDLSSMHSVSGRVTSVEDNPGVNSASVELTDASDKNFVRSAGVDANGNFTVTFVPPGTYNLTVTDAEDTEPSNKKQTGLIKFNQEHTLRSYEDGKSSVIVGDVDVTGQEIELTPSKTTKKDVNLDDLLKQ